jgi:hypothetical protein
LLLAKRLAKLEAAAAARLARASGRKLLTARPRHFATFWPSGERIECGSPRAEAWLAEQRAAAPICPNGRFGELDGRQRLDRLVSLVHCVFGKARTQVRP